MKIVLSLSELKRTDLAMAGGKGANLGALIAAGLPVPPGFCVTTEAYRDFVAANGLQTQIESALDATCMDDPAALEAAAQAIRARFAAGHIPPELASQIRAVYLAMGASAPVAVRSSATAEDLPNLSFAGQQDTYLNIVGEQAVLAAVRDCWGSLWTARAIGYRARNEIAQYAVALAVVVQQMVQSDVSGVLFTANPLTGKRDETIIDATFGLGEALVSGQVEPDHYVVDAAGKIVSKMLGAKALAIRGKAGGGTQTTGEPAADVQALPDEQIAELARLGRQSVAAFGGPQDMEWAFADGKLYVVQSRPITSLYPLPEGLTADHLEVLFSFAVWQGMLDPYTPLGQDMFAGLVAGMAGLFGVKMRVEDQRVFMLAGERLYVNITGLLGNPIGRTVAGAFIGSIDPVVGPILKELQADPRLQPGEISGRDRARIVRGMLPAVGNVFLNLLSPDLGRKRMQARIDQAIAHVTKIYASAKTPADLAGAMEAVARYQPRILVPLLIPVVVSGQIPLQALLRRTASVPGAPDLVLELTRGLPHNVTTEMDLALWRASRDILADVESARHFTDIDAALLVEEYRAGQLPGAAQKKLADFLAVYGLRGIGEIDLGRPRWVEDPLHIVNVLKSYLQITDEHLSPEAVFRAGEQKALQARDQLIDIFKKRPAGWFKAGMIRWAARRVRELTGLREAPKFAIVRLMGAQRMALLQVGEKLAAEGRLERADDLFFLHIPELKTFGDDETRDWKGLIAGRRVVYAREMRRRRLPHLILSDGTTYYESAGSTGPNADTLTGTPVSAGVVEGIVHVVLDPHAEQLAPGEILVCPATDPAWTPLFLAAGGLVMEVGGMITHGSVVAREYGLPAVVGVSEATTRLKTGQRVLVDGSSGKITILQN
jgi:rifampicin phosphotransferase